MTSKRFYESAVLGSLLLLFGERPTVAAPEPLVVTELPDPDPNYVPPPPAPKQTARHPRRNSNESPALDQAFEKLGRVTGQLAQMGQQYSKPSNEELQAQARAAAERMQQVAGASHN